ncbi:MAG TPA: nucleotide sugar dehydrogenase, partial [Flavobacteriaceae bacterium]|nr:nucleotide sugar dehydrogenase [Flavobacteriaceae bacterium]
MQLRDKFQKEEYELVRFHVSSDPTMIKFADIIIICVPTPLSKSRLKPDMSFIDKAIKDIKDYKIKNKLIILESTTYPFTTLDRILPKLQKGTDMEIGENFWLGFSPERIDPANTEYNITNTT